MADDSYASTSAAHATGRTPSSTSAGPNASGSPPNYGLRRAVTVDETAQLRRRSNLNTSPTDNLFVQPPRRRSSNFSDYSLSDARRNFEATADEVWNPSVTKSQSGDKSPYAVIPLVSALLPAVGGMLFQNGSAFFTDVILLALAAIFLHWSVTQPWQWYEAARAVRVVKDEVGTESVFDSDSDLDQISSPASASTALENVPEESEETKEKEKEPATPEKGPPGPAKKPWETRRDAAAQELYLYEMIALLWCFVFPVLGAFLLHTIRGQLSRPSEGLVSDYNLTIFLVAAEVRPSSHLIKLVQSRTLRMQRIVTNNPYQVQSVKNSQFRELSQRLDELEAHAAASDTSPNPTGQTDASNTRAMEAVMARNIRETVQPELDALNRAVRRYEKKLAVLAGQVDGRLEYLDARLNDAIAVAAMAAKASNAQGSMGSWLVERTVAVVMLPVQTAVTVFTFPFRTISSLLGRKSRPSPEKSHKSSRSGKTSSMSRSASDRVPSRMSRR